MDPVQFLKCISFFSLDRIIIYWNRLYDLQSLVGLPVWFCWTNWRKQLKGSNACLRTSAATEERSVSGQNLKTNLSYGSKSRGSLATSWPATWSVTEHHRLPGIQQLVHKISGTPQSCPSPVWLPQLPHEERKQSQSVLLAMRSPASQSSFPAWLMEKVEADGHFQVKDPTEREVSTRRSRTSSP